MILKYLVLSFLGTWLITSSDPYYGSNLLNYSHKLKQIEIFEHNWISTTAFDKYLHDYDNRISSSFKLTPYYYPNVQFWFYIYTQFDSSQIVVHDKKDLRIIYKILDFTSLKESESNRNIHYLLQQKLVKEKISLIQNALDHLAKNPYSVEKPSLEIYRIIKVSKVEIPLKSIERRAFFNELKNNIRSQTGQKDFIRAGVIRALPYRGFLSEYFSKKKLPLELLAIPFLESSFNPKAHSRVNALGVWQFMPLIASYYMPKRSEVDYRSNVGIASISASYLLSENMKILKSWDLAVTAYNSGTKHLLKTKRNLASTADLEDVIKSSDTGHFGFASKNFYSEFLALTYSLAYQEDLFKDIHDHERTDVEASFKFFISKCSLVLNKTLTASQLDDVFFHNDHIKDQGKSYSKGLLLTTKSQLPGTKFLEISFDKVLKLMPKEWEKLVRNQSCSTR